MIFSDSRYMQTKRTLINFYHVFMAFSFLFKVQVIITFRQVSKLPEEQVDILVNVEPCYAISYSIAAAY